MELVSSLETFIETNNQQIEIVFMHQYPINEEGFRFKVNEKVGHYLTSDKIFRFNAFIEKSLK